MSDYNHIVLGRDFRLMDAECVNLVKKLAGKIPQSGIRYIDDNTILLQSHSVHDVLDTVRNGAWAHSTNPSRVKKGFRVYIVPNNKTQELYGSAAVGVSFTADADVYKDINNEFVWASE
jgi:hypothetical protein